MNDTGCGSCGFLPLIAKRSPVAIAKTSQPEITAAMLLNIAGILSARNFFLKAKKT